MTGRAGGVDTYRWDRMPIEAQREAAETHALNIWNTLPLEGKPGAGKYPIGMAKNWPVEGVSLPDWFCFPETSLLPPQGPKGSAESYYPFVPKPAPTDLGGQGGKKDDPPPPPPEWAGWKPGDRIVNQETGEVGVVTRVGPYDPDATPPQDIEVTVTNHFSESERSVDDAIEIGAIARAKAEAGYSEADIAATKRKVKERNKEACGSCKASAGSRLCLYSGSFYING